MSATPSSGEREVRVQGAEQSWCPIRTLPVMVVQPLKFFMCCRSWESEVMTTPPSGGGQDEPEQNKASNFTMESRTLQ